MIKCSVNIQLSSSSSSSCKLFFSRCTSSAYLQVYREGEKEGRKRTAKEVGANNSEDAGIVKELGQEALVRN